MIKRKSLYWLHGGDKTPQYYCKLCDRSHTIHSAIGKRHIEERKVK